MYRGVVSAGQVALGQRLMETDGDSVALVRSAVESTSETGCADDASTQSYSVVVTASETCCDDDLRTYVESAVANVNVAVGHLSEDAVTG